MKKSKVEAKKDDIAQFVAKRSEEERSQRETDDAQKKVGFKINSWW